MKKLLIGATVALLGMSSVQAEDKSLSLAEINGLQNALEKNGVFGSLVWYAEKEAKHSNGQRVIILFKAQNGKTGEEVLPLVRSAIQVRDPNAWFYPYWVTSIVDEKSLGQCGYVSGTWWSNVKSDGAQNWFPRVSRQISDSVEVASVSFIVNGEKTVTTMEDQPIFIRDYKLYPMCQESEEKTKPVKTTKKSTTVKK